MTPDQIHQDWLVSFEGSERPVQASGLGVWSVGSSFQTGEKGGGGGGVRGGHTILDPKIPMNARNLNFGTSQA